MQYQALVSGLARTVRVPVQLEIQWMGGQPSAGTLHLQ